MVEWWRTTPSQNSTKSNLICHVAIVDCTHVRSASASFKDLLTVAQENSTNPTANVLVEDQLQSPLDLPRNYNSTKQIA